MTSTTPRKPAAPHPTTSSLPLKRKLPPPLPALPPHPTHPAHPSASRHPKHIAPTPPTKRVHGLSKTRADSGKQGYGREVVFVTRKTGLGALMGRCRSLVVDEGYTALKLHAVGAAIPQALLLLHALLDLLPYPVGDKGMWYEIRTGSVECVDEVEGAKKGVVAAAAAAAVPTGKGKGEDNGEENAGNKSIKAGNAAAPADHSDDDLPWLKDVGAVEANDPTRVTRTKSTIEIDLHISPRPQPRPTPKEAPTTADKPGRTSTSTTAEPARKKPRNRLSKKGRAAAKRKKAAGEAGEAGDGEEEMFIAELEGRGKGQGQGQGLGEEEDEKDEEGQEEKEEEEAQNQGPRRYAEEDEEEEQEEEEEEEESEDEVQEEIEWSQQSV